MWRRVQGGGDEGVPVPRYERVYAVPRVLGRMCVDSMSASEHLQSSTPLHAPEVATRHLIPCLAASPPPAFPHAYAPLSPSPQGPSFTVEGSLLRWQRWRMRLGFTGREGLVLHGVAYEDGGRTRPVLHRASLVEMAVPYGDPK